MITVNKKNNIEYVSSGLFRSKDMWCHPERIIDSWELIFVVSGKVHIREEECEWVLAENDIALLEPGKIHSGTEFSENVSFWWLHFLTDIKPDFKSLSLENAFSLKTLFSQLMHFSNTVGYSPESLDLISALILEEIAYSAACQKEKINTLAVELCEYISLNITNGVSVRSVAKHFGYHENYIGKVFKSAHGVGMKQYISDKRLKKAKELLDTTLYTVKEIGYIMGFESENHFVKFFKYHTGMTPTSHRNIYVNTHINNE